MKAGELREMLEEYGDHIEVRVLIEGENRDQYLPVEGVDYLSQAPEVDEPVIVIAVAGVVR